MHPVDRWRKQKQTYQEAVSLFPRASKMLRLAIKHGCVVDDAADEANNNRVPTYSPSLPRNPKTGHLAGFSSSRPGNDLNRPATVNAPLCPRHAIQAPPGVGGAKMLRTPLRPPPYREKTCGKLSSHGFPPIRCGALRPRLPKTTATLCNRPRK